MKPELKFDKPSTIATELLTVFAVDKSAAPKAGPAASAKTKASDTPAQVVLLTSDKTLSAAAKSVLEGGEFKAAPNETLLLHAPAGLQAKRILIVGLGKTAAPKPGAEKIFAAPLNDLRKAAATAVRFAKPRGIRETAILMPTAVSGWTALPPGPCIQAISEGIILGDFDTDTYRSDRKDQSVQSVKIVASKADRADAETALREGTILAESQNFARSLINEPGNVINPTTLGERAAAMAAEVGLTAEIYGAEKLHELKMGAFWAVAQGSDQPPALIVLTYTPESSAPNAPVLGLVGKGITFDTGGISIKPADGMEKMKYDMGGGAAMLGAMRAIAQLKPSIKVICVVCAAENMLSGRAYRPGDIVTAMSGKTIEVNNTDAEGRMVLADGLTYARSLGATHLIDAATLTGAVAIALGVLNAGVFANDEAIYEHFTKALGITGERFWRLPLEDDYRDQIKSTIADIMNTGMNRYGGAINAAMFLKEFAEDTPWVHLDIAAVAWVDEAKPWSARGPTGIPVRSVVEWVRSYSS